MTHPTPSWTDDELGVLLTETFHEHETPEDADDACRIARHAPATLRHRLWPALVGAAAAIAVVAGGVTYAAHHLGSGSSVTSGVAANGTVPSHVGDGTASLDAAHRAARAEVSRLVDWVDLGGKSLDGPPAGIPGIQPTSVSTRPRYEVHETRYWVVPGASTAQLSHELLGRRAPIPGATGGGGGATLPDPRHPGATVQILTVDWVGDRSLATKDFASPELHVVLYQDGTSVDVQVEAKADVRPIRPAASYVSGTVSSVTVSYRRSTAYKDRHPAGSAVVTDPSQIARLTTTVNGLVRSVPGVIAFSGCPMEPSGARDASASMVFHSDAGVWRFTDAFSNCGSGVGVTINGHRVTSDLEPGTFASTVWRALSSAR